MSPDKGWFQRQMARTQADVKELPEWLRNHARPINRLLTDHEAHLEATRAARDAALQVCQEQLVEQRVLGHGEGQAHTIADVNAGLVDDLIAPRLLRARMEALSETAQALHQLLEKWRHRAWRFSVDAEPETSLPALEVDLCADELETEVARLRASLAPQES